MDGPVCYAMLYRIHQYHPLPILALSTLVVSTAEKRNLRLPSHSHKLVPEVRSHMRCVRVIIACWICLWKMQQRESCQVDLCLARRVHGHERLDPASTLLSRPWLRCVWGLLSEITDSVQSRTERRIWQDGQNAEVHP